MPSLNQAHRECTSGRYVCRCVLMLGDLWHAPKPKGDKPEEQTLGTSTIGSSEACMLGGLALKRRWQVARKAAGKSTEKPNLVLGINAQVGMPAVRKRLIHAGFTAGHL